MTLAPVDRAGEQSTNGVRRYLASLRTVASRTSALAQLRMALKVNPARRLPRANLRSEPSDETTLDFPWWEVSAEHLAGMVEGLLESGASVNTTRRCLYAVRGVMRQCLAAGLGGMRMRRALAVEWDWHAVKLAAKTRTRRMLVSHEAIELALTRAWSPLATPGQVRDGCIALLLSAGMRPAEACCVQFRDVHLTEYNHNGDYMGEGRLMFTAYAPGRTVHAACGDDGRTVAIVEKWHRIACASVLPIANSPWLRPVGASGAVFHRGLTSRDVRRIVKSWEASRVRH